MDATDTITAIATPPGHGGVGIVRVSGPRATHIASVIAGVLPNPREACFRRFYATHDHAPDGLIDFGLLLFFPGPHSFTGEDVIEFQGHGGPVVMDRLLQATVAAGARLARPGEFSERAFLNNKIDLAQAEAIADLIDSATHEAAKSALQSLSGEFSREILALVEAITQIRIYIEAALDFPDEDVDFLADERVMASLKEGMTRLEHILQRAESGRLLREGASVVIAGKPNAGKSSLLNYLTGHEAAIVTDIAGTTRDVLREYINLDGIPVHLLDTAGLRPSHDVVEREGIRRANEAIQQADLVLLVLDSTETTPGQDLALLWSSISTEPLPDRLCAVFNKADLSGLATGLQDSHTVVVSVQQQTGMDALKQLVREQLLGLGHSGDPILARRRHLDALHRARDSLQTAIDNLQQSLAGELVAEDLKACQDALGEITGTVYPDDLLGRIFSSFCIGK
ncbi:MAG: tRNA uridine-5-carboxymethylaminomethyl(34) synthesis GTPase MnmE [Gammaproteobacteria bacterium]|nr:MAG: tRNA uridine-5-carboxymethylaminomethyl(34) synthesis GTPase MnmE [Gammaproteobacteria bacterium]